MSEFYLNKPDLLHGTFIYLKHSYKHHCQLTLSFLQYSFQEEVIQVAGEEALDIGILSGIVLEAEEVDGLMFPHLQFQEFVAAKYVAERPQVGSISHTKHKNEF